MLRLHRSEWAFLAFIAVYSFVPTFGGLLRIVELVGGPMIVPANARAIAMPLPIVLHVLGSFVFCLLGALQFVPSIRLGSRRLHRSMGKLVAVAGCVSALTGLWMTVYFTFPEALQGSLLYWVRTILSVTMLVLIVWAVFAAQLCQIASHGAAMLRAYAIAQGASTQTFLGIGWAVLMGSEPLGLPRDILMVSAWTLNLMIAEFLIRKGRALDISSVSILKNQMVR